MKKVLISIGLIALSVSPALASDACTNFAGTYKVASSAVTVNGQTMPNAQTTADLVQISQSACQTLDLVDNNPSSPFDFHVIMDGQAHQITQDGQSVTVAGHFEGAAAMLAFSTESNPAIPAGSVSLKLTLSQDQKTLTLDMHIAAQGAEIVSTAVRQ